jgi:hypothetical protein
LRLAQDWRRPKLATANSRELPQPATDRRDENNEEQRDPPGLENRSDHRPAREEDARDSPHDEKQPKSLGPVIRSLDRASPSALSSVGRHGVVSASAWKRLRAQIGADMY